MSDRNIAGDTVTGIGQTIKSIKSDAQQMGQDLVALGKAETKPIIKHAGVGGGAGGVAAVFGLFVLSLLSMAGGFAFAIIFQGHWSLAASLALGFLCMAGVLAILAGLLALVAKWQLGKVRKPTATIDEAKATIEALKSSVQRGKSDVVSSEVERKSNWSAPVA